MLKARIITGFLLICGAVLAILFLPNSIFMGLTGVALIYGFWEWTKLSGIQKTPYRILVMFIMTSCVLLLLALTKWPKAFFILQTLPWIVLGFWMVVPFLLYFYPKGFWHSPTFCTLMGLLVLVPTWITLNFLQHENAFYLLYVMILVWVADIGAYFTGKSFGQRKIAPLISPGKTWEGVLGALALSLVVIAIGFVLLKPPFSGFYWVSLSLITVVFSIFGDLFESTFKRAHNIKDSGNLFPGHGGLLDRIDSLTAALPIFTIGFFLIY